RDPDSDSELAAELLHDYMHGDLHTAFAEDARDVFYNGIEVNGVRLHLAAIMGKGDWKYLRQAYRLSTGYICKDKCHLCEDWHVLSKDAIWRTTIANRTTSPHKTDDVGLLLIPGIRTQTISTDPMHTFHIGWGQDLAASGVILLATVGAFGEGALDSRLEVAYASFIAYCSAHGKTTSCDRFSKQTFDMTSNNSWPTSLGGKAYDTSLVLAWLEQHLADMVAIQDAIVDTLRYTVHCANFYFRTSREHGVFVPHEVRLLVAAAGENMVEGFGILATLAKQRGLKLFRLRPKIHLSQHQTLDLLRGEHLALNTLCMACWQDEDFIGRCSRLARTCGPQKLTTRCMQKALGMYKEQFELARR
ncbi:unnamed protein product, partial [Symbiodinium pilosum]